MIAVLHRCRCRIRSASTWRRLDFEPEAMIASFHGMPRRYLESGRSLSLPVPEDLAPASRTTRLGERALAHDLPIALRQ